MRPVRVLPAVPEDRRVVRFCVHCLVWKARRRGCDRDGFVSFPSRTFCHFSSSMIFCGGDGGGVCVFSSLLCDGDVFSRSSWMGVGFCWMPMRRRSGRMIGNCRRQWIHRHYRCRCRSYDDVMCYRRVCVSCDLRGLDGGRSFCRD